VARDPEELLAGTEQCGEVVVQGLPARVLDLVVLAKCQWQRREVGVVGLDDCGHSLEDVTSIGEMVEGGWREDNPLLLDTQMADEEGRCPSWLASQGLRQRSSRQRPSTASAAPGGCARLLKGTGWSVQRRETSVSGCGKAQ
jgi:hypothetical protein